jgi:hypothetical protein
MSVAGLPTGATGTFNPTSISGGSGTSTLNVSTASTTLAGTYAVSITGSSGALSHSVNVTLVVNPVTGLPLGWTDLDIGAPPLAGNATFSGGTFTVKGNVKDIWSTSCHRRTIHHHGEQFGKYRDFVHRGNCRYAEIQWN